MCFFFFFWKIINVLLFQIKCLWSLFWILIYVLFSVPIAILATFWWVTMFQSSYARHKMMYYIMLPFESIHNVIHSNTLHGGMHYSVERVSLHFRNRRKLRNWGAWTLLKKYIQERLNGWRELQYTKHIFKNVSYKFDLE